MSKLDAWIALISVLSTLFTGAVLLWVLFELPWLRILFGAVFVAWVLWLWWEGRKYRAMWP